MDAEMRALIHDEAPEAELEALARTASASLLEDGQRLVREGVTSLAELQRVTRRV